MTTSDYTGTILGDKYEVIRLLGTGGMGAVYLARHTAINKPVAIKFLHAALAEREQVVKRFYREAQAAAAIRHNSIIDVMDLGVSPEGEPYIVMEYLDGEGLADRIEQLGPLSLAAACGIVEAALPALEAAHEKGIVHRDLKPDNIFLVYRRGELPGVKLIDFGISKFTTITDQTKLTQDGSMLGTPSYMSPEQARGLEGVDHRTDLYAMGVIFYEMLTGEVPFTGNTYSELLLNMITTEPRDPATVFEGFPEAARPVLNKALQKNPAERYQSAQQMLEDVRALTTFGERAESLEELSRYLEVRAAEHGGREAVESGDTQLSEDLIDEMIRKRSGRKGEDTTGVGASAAALAASVKRGVTQLVQGGETLLADLEKRGVWDKAKAPFRWAWKKTEGRPKVRLGAAGGLVLSFVLFTALLCGEGEVRIAVKGAPEDAKIFFDADEMTENPFDVAYSEEPVPLRVETGNRQVFEISIVPSRDQNIEVRLGPAGEPEKRAEKKAVKKAAEKDDNKEKGKKKGTEKAAKSGSDGAAKKVSKSKADADASKRSKTGAKGSGAAESDKPKRRRSPWMFWKN